MQEKGIDKTFADHLRTKLKTLFLHCVFNTPDFIIGEVSKHFELPIENVKLRESKVDKDENDNVTCVHYTLFMFEHEFVLSFCKKVEEPKIIDVPKVVYKPKKWWQLNPSKTIIVEKKKTSEKPFIRWILNEIN